jgi:transcriptional regulator with XRE-family HTH domain
MAKSSPQKYRRPTHPLMALRTVLGWNRETCAQAAVTTAATVQNIERGKAPLQQEAAELLEAETGCNAEYLLHAAKLWERDMLPPGRVELIDITGKPFTFERHEAYQRQAIDNETRDTAIADITTRVDLLLGGLAPRSHKFRSTYRRLIRLLNAERIRSGISDPELVVRASLRAEAENRMMTLQELAAEPDVSRSPIWDAEVLEKFGPKKKVPVIVERFPFWPFVDRMGDDEKFINPDRLSGQRIIWRITLPDKRQLAIHCDKITASGLSSKRLPAPGSNPPRRMEDEAAAHQQSLTSAVGGSDTSYYRPKKKSRTKKMR